VADFAVVVGVVVVGVVVVGVVVVGVEVAEVALDEAVPVADEAVPDEADEDVVDVVCDALDSELVPDVVGEVEPTVVLAAEVAPGISLDTTSPSTAAAPMARIVTVLDMRRTRAPAMSRRWAADRPRRVAGRVE